MISYLIPRMPYTASILEARGYPQIDGSYIVSSADIGQVMNDLTLPSFTWISSGYDSIVAVPVEVIEKMLQRDTGMPVTIPPPEKDTEAAMAWVSAAVSEAVELLLMANKDLVAGLKKDVVTFNNELQTLQARYSELSRLQANLNLRIEEVTIDRKGIEKGQEEMIADIVHMPLIKSFTISSKTKEMVFETYTICARDARTKLVHVLGEYNVRVGIYGNVGRYYITNRTPGNTRLSRPHPHVYDNGTPCLGSIRLSLPEALGRGDLRTGVILLLSFLENVDVNDSLGRRIDLWPIAPGQEKLIEELKKAAQRTGEKVQADQGGAENVIAA